MHQTDVLISMNVLKEVTIVTRMQPVIIKWVHFIANVTLVSRAVELTVMILTNAPKHIPLQPHPVLSRSRLFVIIISIAKIQSEVTTVLVTATESETMGNVMTRNGIILDNYRSI